jgi:hypothetical protein
MGADHPDTASWWERCAAITEKPNISREQSKSRHAIIPFWPWCNKIAQRRRRAGDQLMVK